MGDCDMARIRSVHPALFTDEGWVSCSPMARILFIGLWTEADDRGVFEWKPLTLKMRVLPVDDADVGELLDELGSRGLVRGFSDSAKNYGAIKDFQKYQRPQKPRATYPLPADLEGFVTGKEEPQPDLFSEMAGTGRVESNQMEGRGEEKEGRGRGRPRGAPDSPIPEGFPDQEAISWAEQRAAEEGAVVNPTREAAKFRDHHLSKGKMFKDWRAAWRTWINNAISWAIDDGKVVRLETKADKAAEERADRYIMEAWLIDGSFPPNCPKPDAEGCPVPLSIMAEYGYKPGAEVTHAMRHAAQQRRRMMAQ